MLTRPCPSALTASTNGLIPERKVSVCSDMKNPSLSSTGAARLGDGNSSERSAATQIATRPNARRTTRRFIAASPSAAWPAPHSPDREARGCAGFRPPRHRRRRRRLCAASQGRQATAPSPCVARQLSVPREPPGPWRPHRRTFVPPAIRHRTFSRAPAQPGGDRLSNFALFITIANAAPPRPAR